MSEHLIKLADKIDNRLGPVLGRDADYLATVLRAAAKQIDHLRAEVEEWKQAAQVEAGLRRKSRALNAELAAALKPFAVIADKHAQWDDQRTVDRLGLVGLILADFNRARAALAKVQL